MFIWRINLSRTIECFKIWRRLLYIVPAEIGLYTRDYIHNPANWDFLNKTPSNVGFTPDKSLGAFGPRYLTYSNYSCSLFCINVQFFFRLTSPLSCRRVSAKAPRCFKRTAIAMVRGVRSQLAYLQYVVRTFDLRRGNAAIHWCDKVIFSTPINVVRALWLHIFDLVFLQSGHNFLGVFKKLGVYSVLSNFTARYESLYFKRSLFAIVTVHFCCLIE